MKCRIIQENKVSLLHSVSWVPKLQFCFRPETLVHSTTVIARIMGRTEPTREPNS